VANGPNIFQMLLVTGNWRHVSCDAGRSLSTCVISLPDEFDRHIDEP